MTFCMPLLPLDRDFPIPAYAHPSDAGLDLRSTVNVTLAPGERALIGTGVAVAIPAGHVGFITPRSGLALKHGLSIVNSPGTIDAGYRGEIGVIAINTDPDTPVTIERGERVAQLVIVPMVQPELCIVDVLPDGDRAAGGFGSSGRR